METGLLLWLCLNLALYIIGIVLFGQGRSTLASVIVALSSVAILIPSLKSWFGPEAIWMILCTGGPALLLMYVIARALARRISSSASDRL
ncbi:MAG: hypothetical protein KA109_08420 [Saprospiraceae bacterium]|jgi:hypothetical protein|nr:hypothetical protein [Saprospiraceae bacterium]MBK6477319.1 hypothetical protein [Saprospiraceae bacterium]MBK7373794.1 hypothetical protein [Saprospiraceae bacterium]MBK7437483.1 hypothetical protein [Saprospiraceae bacterium]MBK7608577.1 hypothetical protein [Saprospiraceae bacterium]